RFVAGETAEYTLTVTNIGDGPAYGPVTVTDTLPPGFTLTAQQPDTPGWTCSPATQGNQSTITCTFLGDPTSTNPQTDPPISPNETQSFVVRVNVANAPGTTATNTANVSTPSEPPARRGNNTATTTTPISDRITATKSAQLVDANNNGAADPGEAIAYTITITNISSVPSTNTVFSDPIPEGTTYIPGTTTLNGTTVPDVTGNTMPFSGNGAPVNSVGSPPGEIAPSQTATVQFQVRINNPPGVTQITNQGAVTGTQIIQPPVLTVPPISPTSPPDQPPSPTVVPIGPIAPLEPNLLLSKLITNVTRAGNPLAGINFNTPVTDLPNANVFSSALTAIGIPFQGLVNIGAETPLQSGDEIEYTVFFLSNGSQAVTDVRVCDPIPAGTTFIPDSFSAGSGILLNQGGTQTVQTNASDADQGTFFSPLTPVTSPCPDTNNPQGSVLLQLGDVPNTAPTNAGFVRFRVRVN
ncbi:MAG TPA: hypothetical protein V6C91_13965, partial [Coleofasciculaceae cyanobacterium]